ncbi:MAG: hypothetical protein RMI56_06870 [Sulfolobales archaeon]|nr:hypothetical protein [Sulfolobales archaeon]MDW8083494.1 hypothetical protein [Sulfolobales archaeon]
MIELLDWLIPTLASAYVVYTLTAIGSTVIERSGILNLAIDGLFVLSSSLAYAYAIYLSILLQPGVLATALSLLLTAVTTALLYSIYTALNTVLPVSQGAVGLSFMFIGYGLGAVVGNLGRVLFSLFRVRIEYISVTQNSVVFTYLLMVLAAVLVYLVLYKLKLGVLIRAVGEDPRLVSQIGINVAYVRFLSGLLGGVLIGIGGALFTLWRVGGWSQGQGLSHGWLAYAVSIAGWRYPPVIALVSVFFSLAYVLLPYLQSVGLPIEISIATPYVVSIVAMVFVSITHRRSVALLDPKSLGKTFFREEQA